VSTLTPADATMVKNCLSSLRAKLLGIISRWETSGQGDGGRHNEDNNDNDDTNDDNNLVPDSVVPGSVPVCVSVPGAESILEQEVQEETDGWGGLDGRPQFALDSCENFLLGNPSWYLYFWEMADTYQLLDSTMQRLNQAVGLAHGDQGTNVHKKKRKFDTTGSSIAASDIDSTYLAAQEKTVGRINVLLDQMAESSNTNLGLRSESIRLSLESIDECRKDRNQEKELALQGQVLEKELAIRRRMETLNDAIDKLQMKILMDNLGDWQKDGISKLIPKKKQEVVKLESELLSLK
jgi:hypothetical protein